MAFQRQRNNPEARQLVKKILNLDVPIPAGTDEKVLKALRAQMKGKPKPYDPQRKAESRAKDICRLLPKGADTTTYLDVGCGDGIITAEIGKKLRVTTTYGTDIAGWQDNTDEVKGEITFFPTKQNFPLRTVNVITALQVLHHIPTVEKTLQLIADTIPTDGYFLIREHDASNDTVKDLIDLEHFLYLAAHGQLQKLKDYYGQYRSVAEWSALITPLGFEEVKVERSQTPTRYYYAVYRKL